MKNCPACNKELKTKIDYKNRVIILSCPRVVLNKREKRAGCGFYNIKPLNIAVAS